MTGAVGGGNTNWFVAIQQILSRLESMGPESAAADAQALAQAISAANQAAELLYRFGGDVLQGVAATESENAARQISSDIAGAAAKAQPGIDALVNAQSVLLASQAQRGSLIELQGELMNPLGDAFGAMTRAGLLMTETYNGPMSSAGDGLGLAGTAGAGSLTAGAGGGAAGGGAGSSADPSSAARSSAAGATDIGDYGTQSATPPTAPPGGGTSADPAVSSSAAGSADSPLPLGDGSASGGGGDGPDSLTRGGLGSPDSSSGAVAPAAMMPGSAAGGAGAARLAGGAGGASAGGSGGSSGANTAALSRRLSAPMPSAAAPTTGTPATTPVGAGPSRGGAAPMGAPHGGRGGRGSGDSQHKSAHYLHTTENGADIIGTLPLVGPPVIGDWAPPQAVAPAKPDDGPAQDSDDNPDRDLRL